jgi:predicted ATPase
MHGYYSYPESLPGSPDSDLHTRSHGESFLALLDRKIDSPVLATLPGATILELGEWGIRQSECDDLELVTHWRSYLAAPGCYLRNIID